jgi:CBS domain-containing protein
MRFGAEAIQALKEMKIALVSAARRGRVLNPAQLVKIMQFLYGRHPEIRVRVELLIKPCRSAFVGSDAHEIGLCMPRYRPLFFANVAGALFKSPSQMHSSTILSALLKRQECEFELLMYRRASVASTIGLISVAKVLQPLTARIALRGYPVWVYPETSLMDVSGTIRAILNQKSREVFSISPGATVFEAIELMDAKNVGALLVVKQERLVGVISERDYTRKVVLRGKRSREAKVAEIMSTNVFTTHPREGVDECLRIMTDKHIRHLPVLEGDKIVGVISIGDLVKHVISCQQAAIAHLESYIHGGYVG